MDKPSYGEPLFGLISTFKEETKKLREYAEHLEIMVRRGDQRERQLRKKLQRDVEERAAERERLVAWLDSCLAQQEQALDARYISPETKRVVEIEVSLLRRYRKIITQGHHTKGRDDPFMPRFS
jgi:hypothetical protein